MMKRQEQHLYTGWGVFPNSLTARSCPVAGKRTPVKTSHSWMTSTSGSLLHWRRRIHLVLRLCTQQSIAETKQRQKTQSQITTSRQQILVDTEKASPSGRTGTHASAHRRWSRSLRSWTMVIAKKSSVTYLSHLQESSGFHHTKKWRASHPMSISSSTQFIDFYDIQKFRKRHHDDTKFDDLCHDRIRRESFKTLSAMTLTRIRYRIPN